MTTAPIISGDRLRLRPHVMADFETFWTFYQTPRADMMDQPQNKSHAWYGFASEVGSWSLNGTGGWAIEIEGQFAGQIAVIQPPHFAELELGWLLFDGFEGQGYACEAATLARDYTWAAIRPASLVSYINPTNARSIALAERLGAGRDDQAARHDPDDLVYRHRRPA